jgi:hypothetical protein
LLFFIFYLPIMMRAVSLLAVEIQSDQPAIVGMPGEAQPPPAAHRSPAIVHHRQADPNGPIVWHEVNGRRKWYYAKWGPKLPEVRNAEPVAQQPVMVGPPSP